MNEACLRPQQTPFAYVLNQKIISILEKKRLPYVQYIERKGDEFAGQFAIENLATSLQQHSLRGLIMANCNFDQVMNECPDWRNYKVPYVTISTCGDSDFKIVFDAPHLFRTAFQYFEERGRNNVAIICSTPELPMVREIISSFQGLHSRPEWLIPLSVGPKPEHKGFELMSRLWQGKNHPDALFVADDIATKGVVQAAISMGVKIPKELLILHGANSNTDVFYPIEMPKIEYDLDEIAKKAFELLNYSMSNFNSKSKGVSKMIRARLLDVHSKR